MKRLLIASTMFLTLPVFAQLRAGKILYERTIQPKIFIEHDEHDFEHIIPREKKDRFELLFSEGRSLWQHVEEEHQDDEMSLDVSFNEDETMLTTNSVSDNVIYYNLTQGIKMEQTELGDKRYIITDSVRKMTWKVTGETKTILGYNCTKATTQQIRKSFE
jgi:GLPGLI family protein